MLTFAAIQTANFLAIPYLVREGAMAPQFLPKDPGFVKAMRQNYIAARAVIANCQQNLDVIRSHFTLPESLGSVVFNGVAPAFFEPVKPERRRRLRAELGVGEDGVLCFTAAGLEDIKGHDLQLNAIKALKERPEWARLHFAWAGEDSRRGELKQGIARIGVADRVRLLGHRWDVGAWARDDGLRRRFGEACRQRALAHFTQDRMVETYLAMVERALAPPQPAPGGAAADGPA